MVGLAVAGLAAGLVALTLSAPAVAQIYWANRGDDSIGRANRDGTGVDQGFVTAAGDPSGVAIDPAHLYWTHDNVSGGVARANLNGTQVDPSFIPTAGPSPGVAVDNARVYWSQSASGVGTIGRANLDGSFPNQSFITTGASPCGVAVGPDNVYWANGGDPGTIGNSHIDGARVNQSFVSATQDPCGVAVTDGFLYWANQAGDSIGRSDLDATGADESFIITHTPCGVAVDGKHVYWTTGDDTIVRANLDGSGVDESFITGAHDPCGIAVSPTLKVTPSSATFPATAVGDKSEIRALLVTNTSSSVLDVSGVSIVGANAGDFEKTGDSCTVNVTPAGSGCILNVRFTPTAAGSRSAALRITSNATGSPKYVSLAGTAEPAPAAPRVTGAAVRPSEFAVEPRGASRRGLAKLARGTTFDYSLSKHARVVFAVERKSVGRRVDGRCARGAHGDRGRPRCIRFTPVGRFAKDSDRGANTRRFSGWIGGRALGPSSYRATLLATDEVGNASSPTRLGFRILAR